MDPEEPDSVTTANSLQLESLALYLENGGFLSAAIRANVVAQIHRLAQIVDGEAEHDRLDPEEQPTPQQWLRRFNRLPPEKKQKWVSRIIEVDRRLQDCFHNDHEGGMLELQTLRDYLQSQGPVHSLPSEVITQKLRSFRTMCDRLCQSPDVKDAKIGREMQKILGDEIRYVPRRRSET